MNQHRLLEGFLMNVSVHMNNGMMLSEPTGDDNIVLPTLSGVMLSDKEADKPKVSSRLPLLSRQEG